MRLGHVHAPSSIADEKDPLVCHAQMPLVSTLSHALSPHHLHRHEHGERKEHGGEVARVLGLDLSFN